MSPIRVDDHGSHVGSNLVSFTWAFVQDPVLVWDKLKICCQPVKTTQMTYKVRLGT